MTEKIEAVQDLNDPRRVPTMDEILAIFGGVLVSPEERAELMGQGEQDGV
nr:hypothetical protein [Bacilli bacterium]